MDFGEKMRFYGLDCIGDFVFGEPFRLLHKDEDVRRIMKVNDLSLRMVTVAGLAPWFVPLRSVERGDYLVIEGGSLSGNGPKGTTIYIYKVQDMC